MNIFRPTDLLLFVNPTRESKNQPLLSSDSTLRAGWSLTINPIICYLNFTIFSFLSLVPRPFHHPVFDHLQYVKKGGGRPGPFCHVNDVSVYLDRRGGNSAPLSLIPSFPLSPPPYTNYLFSLFLLSSFPSSPSSSPPSSSPPSSSPPSSSPPSSSPPGPQALACTTTYSSTRSQIPRPSLTLPTLPATLDHSLP